ncbi:MAG TPA: MBL fold metallo-hydrolase [Rickettsiales bacterium]|nr:MBL fold metallo-hydrolase [Rickettsiales bacterium]
MKITVLGCGASSGVPAIGCDCPVCTSENPKNKRTRVSILVESGDTRILVDTPPDMRMQCLREGIKTVDAIIYTHAHADHISGIDDTRSFNYQNNAPVPIYSEHITLKQLQDKFAYCFLPPKPTTLGWFRPCLVPTIVEPPQPFTIGSVEVKPFWQQHGPNRSLGLRFGNMAYSTDVNELPEESLQILEGVDYWIVDCLRYEAAPTHAHLALTLGWIERIKPKAAYLTHMSHGLDYDTLLKELPENVFPAFDGLVITA